MASDVFYAIQPAFTGGEISEDVASRVDIDKYQYSLLQAENAAIRPYGAVKKRAGTVYCGKTKYADKKAILREFDFAVEVNYLLEIGEGYIRVHRDGEYIGVELVTLYQESDLSSLRFVQSVDVLYIASGSYPVKKLMRYTETDWRIEDINFSVEAYGEINTDDTCLIKLSDTEGTTAIEATQEIFTEERIGDSLKIEQTIEGESVNLVGTSGAGQYTSPTMNLNGYGYTIELEDGSLGASVEVQRYVGRWKERNTFGQNEWTTVTTISGAGPKWSLTLPYPDRLEQTGNKLDNWTVRESPDSTSVNQGYTQESAAPGTISTNRIVYGKWVSDTDAYQYTEQIRLITTASSNATLKVTSTRTGQEWTLSILANRKTSTEIVVGSSWKIITHGTWTGTVYVERQTDTGEWKTIRSYVSRDDYNASESGDLDEPGKMRLSCAITSGTCNADLSSVSYTHTGYVRITAISSEDAKLATGSVIKAIGKAKTQTSNFYWGAWSKTNGYPRTVAFFQDRLIFGGNKKYPQRIWMSKSGDYESYEVVKESGTVTDDSAVTADLIALKTASINHLSFGNDLLIFTEGNTWTISGADTVTPSNITPRNQENYGVNNVEPMRIGDRAVYVQRRGSVARDIGYRYDTDSYAGQDLTLLAKHLIHNTEIIDSAYAQEPDSTIYFVLDNGRMLSLTYLMEQKVFAWAHYVTDGAYEAVTTIGKENRDEVYTIVKRTDENGQDVRYIERFDKSHDGKNQQDYIMMDSAKTYTFDTATTEITGLEHLEGKTVQVLADGYWYEDKTVTGGKVTIEEAAARVTVGLGYTAIIEQPNFDAGNTSSGTVQGRKKNVTTAILRVVNSYGGKIGPDANNMNAIIYEEMRLDMGEAKLYSGERAVTLAAGGFNSEGRTYIVHHEPYPFTLTAIIREVTFGG